MRLITKTEGIMRFLAGQETDKICAVLAHAEDGKLAFGSCCCLIGCFTADHALRDHASTWYASGHLNKARQLPYADAAEREFFRLQGVALRRTLDSDAIRRRCVIPLLRYELRRRELLADGAGEAAQPTSRKAVLAK